jgi:hypothetical protein
LISAIAVILHSELAQAGIHSVAAAAVHTAGAVLSRPGLLLH